MLANFPLSFLFSYLFWVNPYLHKKRAALVRPPPIPHGITPPRSNNN